MTFDEFVSERLPGLLTPDDDVTVNRAWLEGLWKAAQQRDPQPDDPRVDTGPGGVVKPLDMKFVPKRWGWEQWIANNELYCGKLLFIKKHRYCSYHYHKIKDEVLYVQQGKLWVTYEINDSLRYHELNEGEGLHVTPWTKHQMFGMEDTLIIEFSTQHFDEDSYRVMTELKVNPLVDDEEIMR